MRAIFAAICILFFVPFFVLAQTTSTSVDVVIEADTLAPVFYKGRHEPSPNSQMRAIAIVDGVSPETYTYRWEVAGKVYMDDHVISFPAPFGPSFRLRVDVLNQSGISIASTERYVSISDTDVVFYTNNLLRGISRTAIANDFILVGDEVDVRAEPYFMSTAVFEGTHDLTWRVDGQTVEGATGDEQTLTLRREEGSGTALVQFSLQNLRALQQHVTDNFTIHF